MLPNVFVHGMLQYNCHAIVDELLNFLLWPTSGEAKANMVTMMLFVVMDR